ncbi:MAG: hypothetical protein H0W86_02855 [Armatimonadetes bacterium]|nr:hypothetical protein [Armatimonadota bacterium]
MLRWLVKLADLDRRWLYLALIIAIILSSFIQAPLTIRLSRESRGFYDAIEKLDGRKPVLLQSDWDMGTIGELRAQFYGVVRHLFRKNQKFVLISGNALGPRFYRPVMDQLAAECAKEYGKDWISVGFKLPDPKSIAIESLSRNFPGTAIADDLGHKVETYPWLKDVMTADDWALAISISYGEFREYITYFHYSARTPYLTGVAAITSTVLYPFVSSGTIKGMLVGSRGGGEYEQAIGEKGYASKFLVGQTAGHLLILLAIIIGNIGQIAKNRLPK